MEQVQAKRKGQSLTHPQTALGIPVKTRSNDRNPHLAHHRWLMHRTEDKLRVGTHRFLDDLVDLMHLTESEVLTARDIDQYTGRARNRYTVEQWRRNGLLSRIGCSIVTPPDTGTHQSGAAVLDDTPNIRKVDVDESCFSDKHRNTLRGVQQHFISLLQGLMEGNSLPHYGKQAFVGDDDHRVHMLAHLGDSFLCLTHAFAALEEERPRDDANRQCTGFARQFADHRRSTRTGTAAHAACDEYKIRIGQNALAVFPVFLYGLTTYIGACTRAEATGELLADLDLDIRPRAGQSLSIGIH